MEFPAARGVVVMDCISFSLGGRRWPLRPDEGEFTAIRARMAHSKCQDIPLTPGPSPSRGIGIYTSQKINTEND